MSKEIAMVRPIWNLDYELHSEKLKDITVLICQRKTKDLTQLTIESLQRFYPDIKILVVDGNSQDDSTLYIRWKVITCSTIQLVELTNTTVNSHGDTMNNAIREHVKTKYFLLMDSDLITERHGHIEGMIQQIEDEGLYSTGTLMLVSAMKQACSPPLDEEDILRYAHPSCSLYNAETYLTLAPFSDHGAPCVWNMVDAKRKGLKIGYYPIDKYTSHLSGASWTEPRTIWDFDHNVYLRPFVTFITDHHVDQLSVQSDHDFDIVTSGKLETKKVVQHSDCVVMQVNNRLYNIRFNVHGEYVCHLKEDVEFVSGELVNLIKLKAIEEKAPDEMVVGGLVIYRRNYWQQKICLL